MVYVNKMDIMGADFYNVLNMLHERLHCNAVPIQLPIGAEDDFKGIVDLLEMKAYVYYDDLGKDIRQEEIPEDLKEKAEQYHADLIEHLAEVDDDLAEKYFADEEITIDEMKKVIRKSTIANTMVPVTCGTSYRNKGVQKLLDAIVDYMPSPIDVPHIKGTDVNTGEEVERISGDDQPFAALAFKIATDPFVGKLCYFRVYSGVLTAGSTVYNSTKDKDERIGRIVQMHSNARKDIDTIYAGDIGAAIGLKNTTTGDTLCDEEHPVLLESMEFPEPVIQLAIEPKTKAGQEKMGIALAKLAEEDPTFRTYTSEETGQTIIAGMGELHLEIIVDRLIREFHVEATVGSPQVAYKESITKTVTVEGRYVRQTGGHGQFGHCKVTFEPMEPGSGFEFVDKIVGGVIPKEYIPAVERGIRDALESGALGGYPVVDVRATLIDGSYHEVDSSEIAFQIAGSLAVKEALPKAGPVLLEPMMKVEVLVPEDYLGDILGNLTARRGHVSGMEMRNGTQVIDAIAPLSEMFGYATDLRSRTQGRGTFTMQFAHYEQAPASVCEKMINTRRYNF